MAVSHVKSNTVADWTGTVTVGNSTGGTQTIAATDLVRPIDWNSAHNQFYTLTGNTTNASTASGSNVVFGATGNLTVSASSDSIIFSAPQREILSSFQYPQVINNTVTYSGFHGSSKYVFPFLLPQDASFSYIRLPVSMSLVSTTFATGAAGYGSRAARSETFWFNIYTQGTGASSRSLLHLTSGSTTNAMEISYSGTASTHSVSYNITFPSERGVSSATQLTSSQQSSAVNEVPAGTSNFTGVRYFDLPFEASLSAGNYYVVLNVSSTTTGANIGVRASALAITQHNGAIAFPNIANNATYQLVPFLGNLTTNSNGTFTSYDRTQVSTVGSNIIPVFQMIREA